MISLIFKLIHWQIRYQPNLILLFLKFSILFFVFSLFLIFYYFIQCYCWRKKIKWLINNQSQNLINLTPFIETGKISNYAINSIKNYLTSLSLILDHFKNPCFMTDKKNVENYIIQAEKILFLIKKREKFLNQQLTQQNESQLFSIIEEVESLLSIYDVFLKENNIQFSIDSQKDYRIFANQDQLLRILNILLLNSIEALAFSKCQSKKLSISLIKTTYFLKITINVSVNLDYLNKNTYNKQNRTFYFSFNLANQLMQKYFQKKITIKQNQIDQTTIIVKIKNSLVLAQLKRKIC